MFIITGASRGIGKYLCERFTCDGELVIGTFNRTQPASIDPENMFRIDITDHQQITNWISTIRNRLSRIVLLNCAGTNYNAMAHKVDMAKWADVIQVNLIGTFQVINAVLPIMREQNWGRIINFASVVAQMGVPGTSAYSASKSALWGMTRAIAAENAKKGISINSLNLGYFDIGMITEVPSEMKSVIKSKLPTGNFGDPENIYNAVKFIISSDYINGTSVDINAGLV